jgi:hypothetical protein
MPDPPGERIRAALAMATVDPAAARAGRARAIGWATVELDRAARELAADLGLAPGDFVSAADSPALGARCRVAAEAHLGGVALAILEPTTEGRLAAMLARFGEGPAAVWFAADDTAATEGLGSTPGPFGPERPVADGGPSGPRWFLIGSGAGTIPT